jgi:hypothetical protein
MGVESSRMLKNPAYAAIWASFRGAVMIQCIGDPLSRVERFAAKTSNRTVCSVIYAPRRGFRRRAPGYRSLGSSAA